MDRGNGTRRPLVTVVGTYSDDRVELARDLIGDGAAVTLCAGPPGCPLLRDEPCPLIETSDLTVLMPSNSADRKVTAGLSLCAQNSPVCVVMEPSPVGHRNAAVHVRFSDMERVSRFVASVLHHPSSQHARSELEPTQ